MKIVANKNAKWTMLRVGALEKYGSKCLGLQIDATIIAIQKDKISEGIPDPVVPSSAFLFEIYDDLENHAGDIVVCKWDEDGSYELTIVMFSDNSRMTKDALRMALAELKEMKMQSIGAVVVKKNPYKDRILSIFTECGFVVSKDLDTEIKLTNTLTNRSRL